MRRRFLLIVRGLVFALFWGGRPLAFVSFLLIFLIFIFNLRMRFLDRFFFSHLEVQRNGLLCACAYRLHNGVDSSFLHIDVNTHRVCRLARSLYSRTVWWSAADFLLSCVLSNIPITFFCSFVFYFYTEVCFFFSCLPFFSFGFCPTVPHKVLCFHAFSFLFVLF